MGSSWGHSWGSQKDCSSQLLAPRNTEGLRQIDISLYTTSCPTANIHWPSARMQLGLSVGPGLRSWLGSWSDVPCPGLGPARQDVCQGRGKSPTSGPGSPSPDVRGKSARMRWGSAGAHRRACAPGLEGAQSAMDDGRPSLAAPRTPGSPSEHAAYASFPSVVSAWCPGENLTLQPVTRAPTMDSALPSPTPNTSNAACPAASRPRPGLGSLESWAHSALGLQWSPAWLLPAPSKSTPFLRATPTACCCGRVFDTLWPGSMSLPLKTCISLSTNVTPVNSIKIKKSKKKRIESRGDVGCKFPVQT